MLRKKLFVFYHHGPGNKDIAEKDYKDFFEDIRKKMDPKKELEMDAVFCPDVNHLVNAITKLTSPETKLDELYFHFSGHGAIVGIPYENWVLENSNFAALLKHPKIKFCFFSSCRSADLAKLVSVSKIPVVIGTAGANDIQNGYAIQFQNLFYSKLLDSFTFKDAYRFAVSNANQQHKKNYSLDSVIRGEGGGDFTGETELNDLKLYVLNAKDEERMLIPPNWVMKMNEEAFEKTWCLNWFDDKTLRDKFYKGLEGEGLGEILSWEELPNHELYLLKDRGNDDPFKNAQVNIILHCSKEDELPEDLRLYLQEPKKSSEKNIKVVFCFRQSLDMSKLFGSIKILDLYPKSEIFKFENYSGDLIPTDLFRKALDRNEISATERRRIVMDFDTKHVKDEYLEIRDVQKFIRIFFAQNTNERLIDFIVNWAKTTSLPNSPHFVSDNRLNVQLDLFSDMENQIRLHFNNAKPFSMQINNLCDTGAILIFRNRSNDPMSSISMLQALLSNLKTALDPFKDFIPSHPIIVFVLHDGIFPEPVTPDERIKMKRFTKPVEVDTDMIKLWAENYSPKKSTPQAVVNKIADITGKFNQDDYREKCPSAVLEFICKELNLPQTVIFKL